MQLVAVVGGRRAALQQQQPWLRWQWRWQLWHIIGGSDMDGEERAGKGRHLLDYAVNEDVTHEHAPAFN